MCQQRLCPVVFATSAFTCPDMHTVPGEGQFIRMQNLNEFRLGMTCDLKFREPHSGRQTQTSAKVAGLGKGRICLYQACSKHFEVV